MGIASAGSLSSNSRPVATQGLPSGSSSLGRDLALFPCLFRILAQDPTDPIQASSTAHLLDFHHGILFVDAIRHVKLDPVRDQLAPLVPDPELRILTPPRAPQRVQLLHGHVARAPVPELLPNLRDGVDVARVHDRGLVGVRGGLDSELGPAGGRRDGSGASFQYAGIRC